MNNQPSQSPPLFSQLMAFCALPLVTMSVGMILIATLYPFTMQWDRFDSRAEVLDVLHNMVHRSSGADDRLNNILLFLPLGFGLAALVALQRWRGRWVFVVAACSAVSLLVECVQVSLPSRAPTAIDIVTNSLGGALGLLTFFVAERLCTTRQRFASVVSLSVVVVLLLTIPLQRTARFSNWDYASSLTIGNDLSDSEPWSGSIRMVALGAADVSTEQLEQLTTDVALDTPPWLVRYDFAPPRSGDAPTVQQRELVALKSSHLVRTENGVQLTQGQALVLPPDATAPLIAALQRESTLTVLLVGAPASVTQSGRIVSIAGDDGEHFNLDISQAGPDVVVRIRTPATGEHGTPALVAQNVFTDQQHHTIAVNYQRGILRLSVDGVVHPATVEITPALAFFALALPFKANIALGRYAWMPLVYTLAYTLLIFVPWGLALALWIQPHRPMWLRVVGALGGSMSVAILYAMLTAMSGGNWPSPVRILVHSSVAVVAWGIYALRIDRRAYQPGRTHVLRVHQRW